MSAGRLDEALRRPGYLWSRWPWLAAAHLLAGSLLPVVTAAVLAVVWLPWWVALARPPGSWLDPTSLALVVVGVVAGVAVLPPVSVLGAHVERLRARLVDPTPIEAPARRDRGRARSTRRPSPTAPWPTCWSCSSSGPPSGPACSSSR